MLTLQKTLDVAGDELALQGDRLTIAKFLRRRNPVTPGVLLIESMAQAGLVALGLYLLWKECPPEEAEKLVTVFVDANVEFTGRVLPGDRVQILGSKVYFRRRKLRSQVEMRLEDGTLVCAGTISGMGVPR